MLVDGVTWRSCRAGAARGESGYGVTFQHGALFSGLTVRENIQLPMIEHLRLPKDRWTNWHDSSCGL